MHSFSSEEIKPFSPTMLIQNLQFKYFTHWQFFTYDYRWDFQIIRQNRSKFCRLAVKRLYLQQMKAI